MKRLLAILQIDCLLYLLELPLRPMRWLGTQLADHPWRAVLVAGPVVLGTPGKKPKGLVMVGLNGTNGASLGAIKIDAVNGYARTTRKPPARVLCSKLVARANRKGIPIGNRRNLGLVRSRATGSGQDPDLDGVPNSLDEDDNGNLILDKFDRSATARASRAARESQAQGPNAFMNLTTTFRGAVDVNAYGSSDQDVREA